MHGKRTASETSQPKRRMAKQKNRKKWKIRAKKKKKQQNMLLSMTSNAVQNCATAHVQREKYGEIRLFSISSILHIKFEYNEYE